jgi:hypothetical protein
MRAARGATAADMGGFPYPSLEAMVLSVMAPFLTAAPFLGEAAPRAV